MRLRACLALICALPVIVPSARAQTASALPGDDVTGRARFEQQALQHPNTNWLRRNAAGIRSIDPHDEDFSDLHALRNAIGDARVVMLGEATHGDGSTFLAKARLVRFLHQEMGFDVLAFESPMYDLEKAWSRIERGMPASEALRGGLFGTWLAADQFSPVVEYVHERAATDRPLRLAGFDSQASLQFSKDSLAADLQGLLAAVRMDPDLLSDNTPLRLALTEMTHYRAIQPWVVDSIGALVAEVTARTSERLASERLTFMKQVLVSLHAFARQLQFDPTETGSVSSDAAKAALSIAAGAVRDEQMAKNLLWLVRDRHAGKKIIVWAASGHTRYHSLLLDDPLRNRYGFAAEYAPMGQWVRRELGDSVYSVLFTSYQGSAFAPSWSNPYLIEIHTGYNSRPELDFEDWMNAAGFRYGFIDLRRPREGGEWLSGRFVARPWSHVAISSRWSEVADGFFFIQRLRSVTRGCPLYRERELIVSSAHGREIPPACQPE